jgi:RNA polymerase sigma-70 factor (ECF subfamily)
MTRGDDLEAIVRQHQRALWRYLRALGAEPATADDLLQDTFLVALRAGLVDRGHAAVATFLRQTARHLFLRRRRDQGRREELLVELADRLWQDECGRDDGEQWLAALRTCVDALDGRPRDVVKLFYVDGKDRAAVAAALGMQENGVKTLLQRVRAVLRACVEQRIGGGT